MMPPTIVRLLLGIAFLLTSARSATVAKEHVTAASLSANVHQGNSTQGATHVLLRRDSALSPTADKVAAPVVARSKELDEKPIDARQENVWKLQKSLEAGVVAVFNSIGISKVVGADSPSEARGQLAQLAKPEEDEDAEEEEEEKGKKYCLVHKWENAKEWNMEGDEAFRCKEKGVTVTEKDNRGIAVGKTCTVQCKKNVMVPTVDEVTCLKTGEFDPKDFDCKADENFIKMVVIAIGGLLCCCISIGGAMAMMLHYHLFYAGSTFDFVAKRGDVVEEL